MVTHYTRFGYPRFRISVVLFQNNEKHQYHINGHGRSCRAGTKAMRAVSLIRPTFWLRRLQMIACYVVPLRKFRCMLYQVIGCLCAMRFPFYAFYIYAGFAGTQPPCESSVPDCPGSCFNKITIFLFKIRCIFWFWYYIHTLFLYSVTSRHVTLIFCKWTHTVQVFRPLFFVMRPSAAVVRDAQVLLRVAFLVAIRSVRPRQIRNSRRCTDC